MFTRDYGLGKTYDVQQRVAHHMRGDDPTFVLGSLQADTQKKLADAQNANALRLGQMREQGETGRAQLQFNASVLPAQLRQQRWDQAFPWIQGQFGALHDELGGGGSGAGPGPEITAGPIYTPQQTQAQVNSMRAANDQKAQSQTVAAGQGLAGKGFGSASPLLEALDAAYQGQAMQASTQGENDLRYTAAKGNADQTLRSQVAREGQFASRRAEENQRASVRASQYSALLGALGGMTG